MRRFIMDFKKYFPYSIYSAKAELQSEVAGSYLNWIWWVLEPISFMLIYTFVFGVIFNSRIQYFQVFIFIGLTAWEFFNKNIRNSVLMVKNNKAIVSKVYMPKFILLISKMFVNGFKMLISFGLVVGMLLIFRVPLTPVVLLFPIFYVLLFMFTFGSMCIVMHLGVFVTDLVNIINIVLRMVFYLTGVFYSIETRIGNVYPVLAKALGYMNPLAYVINSLRDCLLYGQVPNMKVFILWTLISVVVCAIGIRTVYRNENSYVKVI